MDANNASYQYLATKFGEDTITSRHKWLAELMLTWIDQHEYTERIAISLETINHVLIDYFVDIDRLKNFTSIKLVNEVKIYSYLAYWILRRKPLQIIASDNSEDLVFVNEEFVADFLLGFLYVDPQNVSIVTSQRENMVYFEDTLRYFLRYRTVTPQVLELMILGFQAGRGYQFSVDYRK